MESLTNKVRYGELKTVDCPSREVFKHVTSLWAVLCLIALRSSTLRFSELRRKVPGVSEKMLSHTLKNLELDGFIDRKVYDVVPPHVEYSLTPLGKEIAQYVIELADWIELNIPKIMSLRRSE